MHRSQKTFEKVQYPLTIKTLRKVGIEKAFLNVIKAIFKRPTANIKSLAVGKSLKLPH